MLDLTTVAFESAFLIDRKRTKGVFDFELEVVVVDVVDVVGVAFLVLLSLLLLLLILLRDQLRPSGVVEFRPRGLLPSTAVSCSFLILRVRYILRVRSIPMMLVRPLRLFLDSRVAPAAASVSGAAGTGSALVTKFAGRTVSTSS